MAQIGAADGPDATSPLAYLADLLDYTLGRVSETRPGLRGEYFDDLNLTALKFTRADPKVEFVWGAAAPHPSIAPTTFSVRWTGQLTAGAAGVYTFSAVSSDGARLWINDQLVINSWTDHAQLESAGTVTLSALQVCSIKLEHYKNTSSAAGIKLFWSGPGLPKAIIPQSQLAHAALDLQSLVDRFHQPFGALLGASAAAHTPVAQARICSEVLHTYLRARQLPAADSAAAAALSQAEQTYRRSAYLSLLTQIGAPYDQLRLALTGGSATRARLAERLGIAENRLGGLLLDPDRLSAAAIERIFGLADTRRDALSSVAPIGDPQQQLTCWQLDGVEWRRNTDPEGLLYIRLRKLASAYQVQVYRHSARAATALVASGTQSIGAAGPLVLAAANGSGLSGSVRLAYAADSDAIQLSAIPALLAWQLERLRARWFEQDWGDGLGDAGPPLLDPDLVGRADLRAPPAPEVSALWQERRAWIDARLAELRALTASAPTPPAGLDAALRAAPARTPAEPLSAATLLLQADAEASEGRDITAWLGEHDLSRDTFAFLAHIARLTQAGAPVMDAEWADVAAILAQLQKRRQSAAWRAQEQGIRLSLSPDTFQLPGAGAAPPAVASSAWQVPAAARRVWLETLRARVDQERAAVAALQTAVRTVEDATLPLLRDALVLASDAPGDDLEARSRWITSALLIDAQLAGGQRTTRVAQAVETLQGLLTSLRTGQLRTSPPLNLRLEGFDETWQWIGAYASWRAALAVFLTPENLLLPTLRTQQTPGFRALVGAVRGGRRLTPAQARQLAADYADYFRDVCSLTLEAACQLDGLAMFGRGGATGRVYWSTSQAQESAPDEQSFWELVPGIERVGRIVGALPYERSADARHIYLFVQGQTRGAPTLAVTRYDLNQRRWSGELSELELPSGVGALTIVPVQRASASAPPQLCIRGGRASGMYIRSLDDSGDGWASPDSAVSDQEAAPEDDWSAFRVPGYPAGSTLKAALQTAGQPAHAYWLCYQKSNGRISVVKQSGLPRSPTNVIPPVDLGVGTVIAAFQPSGADEIFVVFLDSAKKAWFRRVGADVGAAQAAARGPRLFVPSCGKATAGQLDAIYLTSAGAYRGTFAKTATDGLKESSTAQIAPRVAGPFAIIERSDSASAAGRRAQIQTAFAANLPGQAGDANPATNLSYLAEAYSFVPIYLALQLQSSGHYTAALDWFRTVYDEQAPAGERKIFYGLTAEEALPESYERDPDWLLDPLSPHTVAAKRRNSYTKFTLLALIDCLLDFADAEFTRDTAESAPRARALYLSALELLGAPELQPAAAAPQLVTALGAFPVAANPLLRAARLRAELNLFKLRRGRNIAGLERSIELQTLDAATALLSVGADGRPTLPGTATAKPTPYRFSALIERAKMLVQLASQIEAAMLSALEKRDGELYSLLKARQDVQLTRAGVRLQDLRVREAEDGVRLAELQRERSQLQLSYFSELLGEGISTLELLSLALLGSAALAAALTPGQASGAFSSAASIASSVASFERRRQEWEFQQTLASQDIAIGAQQLRLADDHVRITSQERAIAGAQAEHAEATIDFLGHKFTNAELFDWMSGVLERVYAYFLQQATAVAKLAESQLAFERQAPAPSFILADYWDAPRDGSEGGAAPDRRGLTGSARLLQDIFQLDQYAFETNRRKLQLTKTISLAGLAPAEFERFRQTGVIHIATPMELFDRDFPGHYLRLIRRVRTTVVALIPPSLGIRATLSTAGISRVVVETPEFQPVVVSQPPQSVALSSPNDATGLFELDQQPDMLLPFEGLGVDAAWELRMPRASNRFDYRTIADVLLTIEYTALESAGYRQQVLQSLGNRLSADQPFSFRQHFADQWYDLHNPDQSSRPLTLCFRTDRADFPPNLDGLSIQHVVVAIVPASDQTPLPPLTVTLRFRPAQRVATAAPLGGQATSSEGVISTRRGNAAGWLGILGSSAIGDWELMFEDTADVRRLIADEQLADMLLVLTYQGQTLP